jgi:DNA repair protein RadC
MEKPYDGSEPNSRGHDRKELTWTCRAARDDQGALVWVPNIIIDGHDVAAAILGPVVVRQPVETFLLVCLSERMQVLVCLQMSKGDLIQSIMSAPEKFVCTIATPDTTGFLLVHNHPAGDPRPSADDYVVTTAFALAAAAVELSTHDHVIVVEDGTYFSFKTRRVHEGDH